MITRREFLKLGALFAAGVIVPVDKMTFLVNQSKLEALQAAGIVQTPLAGKNIAQFVDPLPGFDFISSADITLEMREFKANVMPSTFVPANLLPYAGTTVWSYLQPGQTTRETYLGPVIVATRGTPTKIRFINLLGDTTSSNLLFWKTSVDQTLHWADPLNGEANACNMNLLPATPPSGDCALNYAGPIPTVPHLHGGYVPAELDGGPDAWFTSDGLHHGHGYHTLLGSLATNECTYRYPNDQEGALIWFHDHLLGGTRLNVYAGLAGAYALIDPNSQYTNPFNFGMPVVPLVIQDRMFDVNGELFFPAGVPYIDNPEHPYWVPEFIGDTIVVNGKVWPFFNVEPKRYLFLIINGSNARSYEMFLTNPKTKVNGPAFYQVATDGGLLDAPVKIDPNQKQKLVMMPGERTQIIVDFSRQPAGTKLQLHNTAKAPYPDGDVSNGNTTGRIMQFNVTSLTAPDTSYDPATGAALRQPMIRLVSPAAGTINPAVPIAAKRQLTLNEVLGAPSIVNGIAYEGGPLEILVNNTKWSGESTRTFGDFTPIEVNGIETKYSELPKEGTSEVWELINLTADAHPIHTHLIQFQIMNRQDFDVKAYSAAYALAFPSGLYQPSFGPPSNYNVANADGAIGGNPAVTPFLKSMPRPPLPNEAGWKDTIKALPGTVTRIVVRFTPQDVAADATGNFIFEPGHGTGYVWHCHIVDHEDNEMMRPYTVIPASGATRTYDLDTDY